MTKNTHRQIQAIAPSRQQIPFRGESPGSLPGKSLPLNRSMSDRTYIYRIYQVSQVGLQQGIATLIYGFVGTLLALASVPPFVVAAPKTLGSHRPLKHSLQSVVPTDSLALSTVPLHQRFPLASRQSIPGQSIPGEPIAGDSIDSPFTPVPAIQSTTPNRPQAPQPTPRLIAQTLPSPPVVPNQGQSQAPTQSPTQSPVPTQAPNPSPASITPLVPNPKITIQDSQPAGAPQPSLLPQAVPPPLGDVSATSINALPIPIDLGTNARISQLVLRDAPTRDVLAILVRAAGLNFAYTGDASGGNLPPGQVISPGNIGGQVYEGPKISVDFKDESIQSAFNNILQLTNFSANRIGNTIVVGPTLPNGARNLFSRSFRLNQVTVSTALNFFVGLGAESAISRERTVTTVNAVPVGANFGDSGNTAAAGNASVATQTQTSTEARVEVQRVAFQDAAPILRGMQVIGDERTNTLTFVGSSQQVQIATQHLRQLDIRRRQAIINVRIIDVNLLATSSLNSSFSFGVNSTFTSVDGGAAVVNFGNTAGAFSPSAPVSSATRIANNPLDFTRSFLGRLQASIVAGSSKILTDPTLTVQEGQTAQINLTQEVFGGLKVQQSATGAGGSATLTTQEPIIKQAGLTVSIKLDRIDDNGFISLSVAPTVSAPNGTVNAGTSGTITLLSQRSLTSGQLRLRDGQTLILAGIIQDSDRTSVTKVPLLGDIPLLGTLFRSTDKNNQRQEVIVLLTPQIIDDSDRANFGYGYVPSPNADPLILRDRKLNPKRKP